MRYVIGTKLDMLLEYSVNNFNRTFSLPTPKSQSGGQASVDALPKAITCITPPLVFDSRGFRRTNWSRLSILRATCNAKIELDHHTAMDRKPPSQIPQGFTPTPSGKPRKAKNTKKSTASDLPLSPEPPFRQLGSLYIYWPQEKHCIPVPFRSLQPFSSTRFDIFHNFQVCFI